MNWDAQSHLLAVLAVCLEGANESESFSWAEVCFVWEAGVGANWQGVERLDQHWALCDTEVCVCVMQNYTQFESFIFLFW